MSMETAWLREEYHPPESSGRPEGYLERFGQEINQALKTAHQYAPLSVAKFVRLFRRGMPHAPHRHFVHCLAHELDAAGFFQFFSVKGKEKLKKPDGSIVELEEMWLNLTPEGRREFYRRI